MARAKSDDDRIPFTLRVPPDLHADLLQYAVDSSLNAEIIRRLRYTVQLDMVGTEMRKPENQPVKARVEIQLRAEDRELTWDEIRDRVAAAVSGLPQPVGNVAIELISRGIALSTPIVESVLQHHDAQPAGGLEKFIREHAAGTSVLDKLVREEAPEGMSLKGLLDRIEAGEDPEIAFRAELRAYLADHGGQTKSARSRNRQS